MGIWAEAVSTSFSAAAQRVDLPLGELVDRWLPPIDHAEIERLERIIRDAQRSPPEDRAAFVTTVNALLKSRGLCLRGPGGDCGLLRLARTQTYKRGSISVRTQGNGSVCFRKTPDRIVFHQYRTAPPPLLRTQESVGVHS